MKEIIKYLPSMVAMTGAIVVAALSLSGWGWFLLAGFLLEGMRLEKDVQKILKDNEKN